MNQHVWWMYVATVFVISAIPGPNMLLIMTHSARFTLRSSIATMAGCLTALLIMQSISAAGLGVFLTAWPALFNVLRVAGAVYLVYLGIKSWRAPVAVPADGSAPAPVKIGRSPLALFRHGFLVASSNPKALLFAIAFLPQFISASTPKLPQFAILIATFVVIEVSWYFIYAAFGSRIGEQLRSQNVAKIFNRLTGGIFVGFGAMLALVRH
jgi:threonine/homoserine/homoserine lactone efflux protein